MPQPLDTSDFLGGKLRITQPVTGYRAGSDAVLLAAAIQARPTEQILDAGCGVGTVGQAIATRLPDCQITGVDIQPEFIDLAEKNAAANNLTARMTYIIGDIMNPDIFAGNVFDQIVLNPPFFGGGVHTPSPDASRAIARGETEDGATISDWISFGHRVLKQRGRLTLINRVERLEATLDALKDKFGAVILYPLWPRLNMPAKRIIVTAVKDRRDSLQIHPGLVLHHDDSNSYTEQATAILAGGKGLDIAVNAPI